MKEAKGEREALRASELGAVMRSWDAHYTPYTAVRALKEAVGASADARDEGGVK